MFYERGLLCKAICKIYEELLVRRNIGAICNTNLGWVNSSALDFEKRFRTK